MNFYHGTTEEFAIDIFSKGKLSTNNYNASQATQLIDRTLKNQLEENIREDAIYMWQNIEDTDGAECVIKISIDKLDITKLYVGDYEAVNDLYNHVDYHMPYTDSQEFLSEAQALAEKYKKSFIPFEEYIKNKDEYEKQYAPEFLYFGEIDVERDEEYIDYLKTYYDMCI